ncbi:LINE-1 type transposase domain-containing protein 1 [Acipenser ruthenus]|uniref:LINE-1 type transposase domain-containing protein 1 n=1 Tax=Acipenser ruthenus TaxID=7906 RepID=A0A444UJW7_ACIRT|nr:LINE-1 type transposase domain-containing protein 1 [Acipenser ruthenus]
MISGMLSEALDPLNKVMQDLKENLNIHIKTVEKLTSVVDAVKADMCQAKREVNDCMQLVDKFQDKLNDLEDRSWRCNVRLVGLPEGSDRDDPARYLQKMLPRWIDRAHRVYSGGPSRAHKPCTLLFKLLRYTDRQAILQGTRNTQPMEVNGRRLSFFVDYSQPMASKRKAFSEVRARLRREGVESFLIYPAVLRVSYGGEKLSFGSVAEVETFDC